MARVERVEKPSQWCAGMCWHGRGAKANRIYADLKPLNKHMMKDPYFIQVDETLAQLSGAAVFSNHLRSPHTADIALRNSHLESPVHLSCSNNGCPRT